MKTYKGLIGKPSSSNQVLVGGTNFYGAHGAGVAKLAVDYWGAIYGQAKGLQGQFYGIITKDLTSRKHPSVSKEFIVDQLADLCIFAKNNPKKDILIAYTAGGQNLNGYSAKEMAEMFNMITWPKNVVFEDKFYKLMCQT